MATVEEITCKIMAIDDASKTFNNVSENINKTTEKIGKFNNLLSKRISMVGALEVQRVFMNLAGNILPGVERAFLLVGASIQKLFVSLGPIGWAIAGITIAFTTLKNIIDKVNSAKKELIDRGVKVASTFSDIILQSQQLTVQIDKYYKTVINLIEAKKELIRQELQSIANRSLLSRMIDVITGQQDKDKIKAMELEAEYLRLGEQIKKLTEHYNKLSTVGITDYTDEEMKMLDEAYKEFEDYITKREELEETFSIKMRDLTYMVESEKMSIRELALYQAEKELSDYMKFMEEAERYGIDVSKMRVEYQMALEKKFNENVIKISQEKNKFLVESWLMTTRYLSSISEKYMLGEKLTFKDLTIEYVKLWIDAIQKRLEAEMIVAIATGDIIKAGMIAAGITALGGLKGFLSVARGELEREERELKIAEPELPEMKELTTTAKEIGKTTIHSAQTNITNYITISPKIDLLDITTLSEARLKEISEKIGQYIMEGMARGQYGLS
ncbi:MAG: hypothetical protein QXN68_00850 [Thermoplasmata archaeon]